MSKKELKPKIRFKGENLDWRNFSFDDFATYKNGKAHEQNICDKGKYIVVNSKFVSSEGKVKKYTNKLIEPLKENDIAFVLSDVPNGRAIAKTFLVKQNNLYTLNQRIAGISVNNNFDPKFIRIKLNRNKYFLKFDDGVKQTNLTKDNILEFCTLIPIIDEQKSIGEFFDKIDKSIKQSEEKVEKWKNIRTSLLSKMFPKEGKKVPELRFKGFSGEWEYCKIGDIVDFYNGHDLSWNDIDKNGKYECVLYGNLYTDYGMIIYDKIKYKTNKELKSPVPSCEGDILIPSSDTTPTGLARATSIKKAGVILGGGINILRPYRCINGSFLSLIINSNKNELIRLIKGTTVRHIYNDDIKNIIVPITKNIDEQQKIVDLFIALDKQILMSKEKTKMFEILKNTFLNKMFV